MAEGRGRSARLALVTAGAPADRLRRRRTAAQPARAPPSHRSRCRPATDPTSPRPNGCRAASPRPSSWRCTGSAITATRPSTSPPGRGADAASRPSPPTSAASAAIQSRGLWPGADGLLADARAFAAQVRGRFPCTPMVILGHSMGGGVGAGCRRRRRRGRRPRAGRAGDLGRREAEPDPPAGRLAGSIRRARAALLGPWRRPHPGQRQHRGAARAGPRSALPLAPVRAGDLRARPRDRHGAFRRAAGLETGAPAPGAEGPDRAERHGPRGLRRSEGPPRRPSPIPRAGTSCSATCRPNGSGATSATGRCRCPPPACAG